MQNEEDHTKGKLQFHQGFLGFPFILYSISLLSSLLAAATGGGTKENIGNL